MVIFVRSAAKNLKQLTLFVGDFPASQSASPARGLHRRMIAGYGRSSSVSFAQYDPDTSLWKTFQGSLAGGWVTYSETWPRAGMMRNGIAYRRQQSVPRTCVTGSSSWPTVKRWPTPLANKIGGCSGKGFPPTLEQVVKRYPTPRAQMERKPCWDRVKSGEHKHNLEDFIAIQEGASADDGIQCLNPDWVELLMGFPLSWTEV